MCGFENCRRTRHSHIHSFAHSPIEKCGWRDSNPHASRRQILSLVRLPISPHPLLNVDSLKRAAKVIRFPEKQARRQTFTLRPIFACEIGGEREVWVGPFLPSPPPKGDNCLSGRITSLWGGRGEERISLRPAISPNQQIANTPCPQFTHPFLNQKTTGSSSPARTATCCSPSKPRFRRRIAG